MINFLKANWPAIIVGIGIFSTICMGLGRYMESNDVKWDDGAAKFLKWLGGLGNVITSIFKGSKK